MHHRSFLPFGTRTLVTVKEAGSWCKKAWLPTCQLPCSRQLSIGAGEMGLESWLCQDLTTTTTQVSSEPGSSHL